MTSQSEQTPSPAQPGNDGSWFLDAIGAKIVDPSPTNGAGGTDGALTGTEPTADAAAVAKAPAAAAAAAVAVAEDPLTDFTPQQLDKRLESSRSWRWPVVLAVGAVLALALLLLIWLPGASDQRAETTMSEYEDVLAAMLSDLAPTQQALETLTDPGADVPSFGALVAPITKFQADSDAALILASQPLPTPLPLGSSEPFDALVPVRDAVATNGTTGDAIARRMTDLLDYRTIFDSFLDTGPLPTESEGTDLNALATNLSTTAVDGATILSELPNDAALAEHKAAAEVTLIAFSDDHLGYLDALRTGDVGTATAFVNALADDRANLDRLMAEALRRMRGEIDAQLVALSVDIAVVLGNGTTPAG